MNIITNNPQLDKNLGKYSFVATNRLEDEDDEAIETQNNENLKTISEMLKPYYIISTVISILFVTILNYFSYWSAIIQIFITEGVLIIDKAQLIQGIIYIVLSVALILFILSLPKLTSRNNKLIFMITVGIILGIAYIFLFDYFGIEYYLNGLQTTASIFLFFIPIFILLIYYTKEEKSFIFYSSSFILSFLIIVSIWNINHIALLVNLIIEKWLLFILIVIFITFEILLVYNIKKNRK